MGKHKILRDWEPTEDYREIPSDNPLVKYYAGRSGDIISCCLALNRPSTIVSDVKQKAGRSRAVMLKLGKDWGGEYSNVLRENAVWAAWHNLPEVPQPKATKYRLLEHIDGNIENCAIDNLRIRRVPMEMNRYAEEAYAKEWNFLVGSCVMRGLSHEDAEDYVSACFMLTLVTITEKKDTKKTKTLYGCTWNTVVNKNFANLISGRTPIHALTRHIY